LDDQIVTWFIVILLGLIAVPIMMELTRRKMGTSARDAATGHFATLSQGVTHFSWFGPQRGSIVVCVHGLTTPSFVWRGLTKGLAILGYRVLTYDLYGRGFSDKAKGPQDSDFFLRQLNDLLDHEGVARDFVVVGYSMGGAIATLFTAQDPSRVRQLVLIAPAGMGTVASPIVNFIAKTPMIGDWLMLALYPSQMRKGIAAERGLPSSVEGITELQENELTYRGFVPAILSSLRGVLGSALEEEHRAIHSSGTPVLAIWGQDDDVIPIAAVGTLAQWSRGAVQEVIEGAGHGLTYTHTDEILAVIAANIGD
jgi:pimeloyl-ACP methyl ester carboxylesterase